MPVRSSFFLSSFLLPTTPLASRVSHADSLDEWHLFAWTHHWVLEPAAVEQLALFLLCQSTSSFCLHSEDFMDGTCHWKEP